MNGRFRSRNVGQAPREARRNIMKMWQRSLVAVCAVLVLVGGVAYAQVSGTSPTEFPYTGNRTAVWIVAQLHTLFGAFILGAPIFIVISEWLGYRRQDLRYDRLDKEVNMDTVIHFILKAIYIVLIIFISILDF